MSWLFPVLYIRTHQNETVKLANEKDHSVYHYGYVNASLLPSETSACNAFNLERL